ncbi:MAG: DNA mismatch repair protein MutS [Lachnospiraceae bacterium]
MNETTKSFGEVEFYKIVELWKKLAVTDAAKEEIQNVSLCFNEGTLRKLIKDTTDARNMLETVGIPPLQNVTEMKEVLLMAEKGECLSAYQLERVEKVLTAVKRLKEYLVRGKCMENSLGYYEENLDSLPDLREEILAKIRGEEVEDHASKELECIRREIIEAEDAMKQKANQILRSQKECMADNFYTFRNGRICVPVKKDYKWKIAGTVVDKSSTGNTIFMEPAGVMKINEQLQELKMEEENEVYRILYTLSALVLASAETLSENIRRIEALDYIFSKGKLSMELAASEPEINTERHIKLINARHPLMGKETAVPLQFEIGDTTRGIIITGPNTGGKTVAIKTVMLNCIMAQCGLHVTCEKANVCMNSAYLSDIGDGQNLEDNLSTFSAHITNVLNILSQMDKDSLIIMDELGSGTDPTEGMGIAISILEELRKSGALFLVTTHYPEVKDYAQRTEGICNARMLFDKETLRPTYQMIIGEAGESCAFCIAERLGFPNAMLRVALEAAYGENAAQTYSFQNPDRALEKKSNARIQKMKQLHQNRELRQKFHLGDSVMVYPEKKIGIVCEPMNEKGVLRVQMPDKKIWLNHKRVKLHVAATQLYPEDYDFSILFDTVENRKIRHDMERKYTEAVIRRTE